MFCFREKVLRNSLRSDEPVKVMRSVFLPPSTDCAGREKSSLICVINGCSYGFLNLRRLTIEPELRFCVGSIRKRLRHWPGWSAYPAQNLTDKRA